MTVVVVGYDASPASDAALAWAAREAGRLARRTPVTVQVVYVRDMNDTHLDARPHDEVTGIGAWSLVERAAARVRDLAGSAVTVESFVEYASPAAALVGFSDGADLVVVGSTPRGALREELRGSCVLQVAAHARCPVVAVPASEVEASAEGSLPGEQDVTAEPRPVVVGYDGSAPAGVAIDHAADAALAAGLPLRVVVAWWTGPMEWAESYAVAMQPRAAAEAAAERTLAEAFGRVEERVVEGLVVDGLPVEGRPVDVLTAESEHADRLVIGTRGRGGFAALVLGSVTHTLLRTASCPVVVARA
ncbi:universal stress protein [Antribacter sp. KLBMP9083]|uniref:Universal stress protein n=1 Tax=Antribacter soli TaxID=2910976 RepID=A0AA41U9B9_9MICO|nr:universal stress protein [Antribacter soli]MCF4121442.1 universal stress protein [Antribacter soli]